MSDAVVEGIVVGLRPLGEVDRIVRLLTAEGGRVDVVARGARRSKKRFAGVLELGVALEAQVRSPRRAGGLLGLTEATVSRRPKRVREDYDRIVYLGYGAEVIDSLVTEDLPAPKLHGLMAAWLDVLEQDQAPGVAARVALEAKALTFAGVAPQLVRCASCGQALSGDVRFATEGGGHHTWCGGGSACTAGSLAQLEVLRRTSLSGLLGAPSPEERWLLTDVLEAHARRALKTRPLLTTTAVEQAG